MLGGGRFATATGDHHDVFTSDVFAGLLLRRPFSEAVALSAHAVIRAGGVFDLFTKQVEDRSHGTMALDVGISIEFGGVIAPAP